MLILNFFIYEPLIAETRPFLIFFVSNLKISKLLPKFMSRPNKTNTFEFKLEKVLFP